MGKVGKRKHALWFRALNVARVAAHADSFYQVWSVLSVPENYPHGVWSTYSNFWAHARKGVFEALINNCAMVDDNNSNGHSISGIIDELIELRPDTDVDLLALRHELRAVADPIAKRVKVLRNNLFAHRSVSITFKAAMDKAAITPDDLRILTETYVRITEAINIGVFKRNAWPKDGRRDAQKLLHDLGEFTAAATETPINR